MAFNKDSIGKTQSKGFSELDSVQLAETMQKWFDSQAKDYEGYNNRIISLDYSTAPQADGSSRAEVIIIFVVEELPQQPKMPVRAPQLPPVPTEKPLVDDVKAPTKKKSKKKS